jgi:BASS family bile acid:Na+ symporter
MTLDQCINLLVTITLIEMTMTVGLGVTLVELLRVATDGRLLLRAAVANYICVPAVTLGLLLLFDATPMVAAGFLILAVCPGAPFGPPLTALARGDVPVSVGLMVILAGSSALVAPVLLHFLLPLMSGEQALTIDATRLVTTLLMTQFVPLGVGLAVRHWRPRLADRLQPPAQLVSKMLNLVVIVVILAVQFHLLLEVRPSGYAGMLALLLASLAAGWLLGGPGSAGRKAMTLTAALRNVAVGLVIASSAFAGTPAVTAVLAYGVIELAGVLLLALVWGRCTPAPGEKRMAEDTAPVVSQELPR